MMVELSACLGAEVRVFVCACESTHPSCSPTSSRSAASPPMASPKRTTQQRETRRICRILDAVEVA